MYSLTDLNILLHSIHIPSEDIVWSLQYALALQRELAGTTKVASLTDRSFTKGELHAPKRLKNNEDIVILPADKGGVTFLWTRQTLPPK